MFLVNYKQFGIQMKQNLNYLYHNGVVFNSSCLYHYCSLCMLARSSLIVICTHYVLCAYKCDQVYIFFFSLRNRYRNVVREPQPPSAASEARACTPLEVDRFFPSTQLCPSCGQKNKLSLSDRMYVCDCGFVRDRD
ncbi:MAG: transposase, partial [Candidatus Competibacteraceae bacterium]|nr:transposase [Candidatus Competibacteraceae bacterium]